MPKTKEGLVKWTKEACKPGSPGYNKVVHAVWRAGTCRQQVGGVTEHVHKVLRWQKFLDPNSYTKAFLEELYLCWKDSDCVDKLCAIIDEHRARLDTKGCHYDEAGWSGKVVPLEFYCLKSNTQCNSRLQFSNHTGSKEHKMKVLHGDAPPPPPASTEQMVTPSTDHSSPYMTTIEEFTAQGPLFDDAVAHRHDPYANPTEISTMLMRMTAEQRSDEGGSGTPPSAGSSPYSPSSEPGQADSRSNVWFDDYMIWDKEEWGLLCPRTAPSSPSSRSRSPVPDAPGVRARSASPGRRPSPQ
jgi:hypothetical protein